MRPAAWRGWGSVCVWLWLPRPRDCLVWVGDWLHGSAAWRACEQGDQVKAAFAANRELILMASQCKKPDQKTRTVRGASRIDVADVRLEGLTRCRRPRRGCAGTFVSAGPGCEHWQHHSSRERHEGPQQPVREPPERHRRGRQRVPVGRHRTCLHLAGRLESCRGATHSRVLAVCVDFHS